MLPLAFSGKCMSGGSIPFLGAANFKWTLRKGGREGVWPKRPVNINRGESEYVDGPLVKKNDRWSSILGQLLYAGIKLIYMEN